MYRTNSPHDVAATGLVKIDTGDHITVTVPTKPTPAPPTPTRDTGTLDLSSSFTELTRGQITVRRVGETVYVTLYDCEFADSSPPEFFYLAEQLPAGFRPVTLTSFTAMADVNGTVTRRVRFQSDGSILLYDITPQSRINLTANYLTPDTWPTT